MTNPANAKDKTPGNATPVKAGDKTPLWTASSTEGPVSVADVLGKQAVLLIFYSGDWTDVCSDELPLLEELIKLAGPLKLKSLAISADSLACHKAFGEQIGLEKIVLVSDYHHALSQLYGLTVDEEGASQRATILIDPAGIVREVNIEPDKQKPRSMAAMENIIQQVREWNGYPGGVVEWKKERLNAMQLRRSRPLEAPTRLQLRFWGTRGSIPVSGLSYVHYGGNTSCVSLTSDTGHLFVFDCGSGARELGQHLLANPEPGSQENLSGYIILSHTHWDHIQGFPFFAPVFRPGNRFNILGWSNCSQTLSSIMAGQMEKIYFPVSLSDLPSELNFYSLQFNEALLDGAKLTGRLLKHPLPSTAYRLELGGKILVYATDHEPLSLPDIKPDSLLGDEVIDPKLVQLAAGADVLIHDAQYSLDEMAEKVGWGHNSGEVAVDTAIKAGVKHLVLFHHDPAHDDRAIDTILKAAYMRAEALGHKDLQITAASDGFALNL
jgi:phosphoribosyl 1,2-cyclic phosphodiesterase/peroxiredoxin